MNHTIRKKIKRNFKVYSLYYAFWGFGPHLLISLLYFEQLTASYALSSLVFSMMFFSTTISEIPIGVFSDFIGRRKTMICGAFCIVGSVAFYILASYVKIFHPAYLLCIGGFFHGLGRAFFSGTDEALIYESSKFLKNKDFKKYLARGKAFNNFATGSGALVGGVVAYCFSYEACHWISLFVYTGLIFIVFFFYDVPKENEEYKNTAWKHIKEAISNFRKNSKLRLLAVFEIIDDSIGGTVYRYEIAFLKFLIPEYLLGVFRGSRQYISAISYMFARKFVLKFGSSQSLFISSIVGAILRIFPIIINNLSTPILLAFSSILNGPYIVSISEKMQLEFSNDQRATMKSLISIFTSFFEGVVIFIIGLLADAYSLRVALITVLLVKIVPIFLCFRLIKMEKKENKS